MATENPTLSNGFITKYSDIFIAVAIVTIVIMMIIPLPTALLDLLICVNITLALVIVMVTIYNVEALDFSVFPSLLLVTTLFRLALNISATRLILLNGYAGDVIMAFGNFVVGGNALVGFIIFVILVIIQFIVITKGAERVAEVSARFTLDAMPGKQMAIDADLNQGAITDAEASKRRLKIQQEADFYGAMDGASKFVKGDAIAAIVIIIINITGGFVIGMLTRNMSALQALQSYTLLTVGEGLVSQIPALMISTATGILVTRSASSKGNLGLDVAMQLFNRSRIFYIVSGVLMFLAIVPGMPGLPLAVLSILCFIVARRLKGSEKVVEELPEQKKAEKAKADATKPENIVNLLQVDPMELEIGYSLIPLVDTGQGGDLLERIVMIRRQCALELGLVVPTIRIRDNIQIKPNSYIIKLKGIETARGELMLDHYLAMNSGTVFEEVPGIETTEPAFGLPALWISEDQRIYGRRRRVCSRDASDGSHQDARGRDHWPPGSAEPPRQLEEDEFGARRRGRARDPRCRRGAEGLGESLGRARVHTRHGDDPRSAFRLRTSDEGHGHSHRVCASRAGAPNFSAVCAEQCAAVHHARPRIGKPYRGRGAAHGTRLLCEPRSRHDAEAPGVTQRGTAEAHEHGIRADRAHESRCAHLLPTACRALGAGACRSLPCGD